VQDLVSYRIGIDIGGTFTDFAMVDDDSGDVTLEKILTTPHDPSVAVLEGVSRLLGRGKVSITQVESIIHGSTLVTNAVIERKGAPTGMLVTKGFGDVLDIALERRYDLYDLRLRFPDPLVPRSCRMEIDERMRDDGTPIQEPNLTQVEQIVRELVRVHSIRAVAVCFLHSYCNPEHERIVTNFVRRRFPELFVSSSAEILPFIREYERWTTTIINAFVQPSVDSYLSRIENGLSRLGFKGGFYIMTSSGGTFTADMARRYPVRMLESGPAAGVFMAAHHGSTLGIRDLLSFDMGGTTAKGAIVRGGNLHKKYELEVARIHEFKTGSGLPVRIPTVDMIEIGAGGGSIAELDDRGVIRVGPRSAGAVPGPACYGRSGESATLTDANLTLGYLDPKYFLGGAMELDRTASVTAINSSLSHHLGVDTERAAWGIHETTNEDVARAFRVHASDIGFDYRNSSMVTFGGSGPAHAARIARKLRIPRVVFPSGSGVMSAIGMLVSPLSYQLAKTNPVYARELSCQQFVEYFRAIQQEAESVLVAAGIDKKNITVERHLDMRYKGQGYEIEVALPASQDVGEQFERLPALFAESYERVFSLSYLNEPIEILHWKVDVSGPAPVFDSHWSARMRDPNRVPLKGTRKAYFPEAGGYIDCPIYDRYALAVGVVIEGPAIIEERESTCVLGVDDRGHIDAFGNLLADIGGRA
jgi:N-methylhydantoinase A